MLDAINLDTPSPSKKDYKLQRDTLMEKLILLQQEAREKQVGLVVLFEGWNGSGKGSRISDILYLLDARATSVCHTSMPNMDEVTAFSHLDNKVTGFNPLMKFFWENLGERGTTTFYDYGWYFTSEFNMIYSERARYHSKESSHLVHPRVPMKKLIKHVMEPQEDLGGISTVDKYVESIESWERSLTENGYMVVKFFVHINKKTQRQRLEALYDDPDTRWRVSEDELLLCADYDNLFKLHDAMLEKTNFDFAPWNILNGENKRESNLRIAQAIVDALEKGIAAKEAAEEAPVEEVGAPILSRFPICTDYPNLDEVEHTLALTEEDYREQLKKEQRRFFKLELEMYQQRVPLLIMYEGWDAAGKGGAIKRVAQALDARAYKIYPSPAPTKAELAHPHLWRYWTRLPKAGHVGIYDRSWYGRVLVERVENITKPKDWARGYDEINEFERDLVDWGALLIKFWVNVSEEEQLKRFEERQNTPSKQWKITDEDWRNREKNPQYHEAIQDMFRLTSTTYAPWTILESDNKYYARVKSLRTINDALEKRLGLAE